MTGRRIPWMRTYNVVLAGRPVDLIQRPAGFAAVLGYLTKTLTRP